VHSDVKTFEHASDQKEVHTLLDRLLLDRPEGCNLDLAADRVVVAVNMVLRLGGGFTYVAEGGWIFFFGKLGAFSGGSDAIGG